VELQHYFSEESFMSPKLETFWHEDLLKLQSS